MHGHNDVHHAITHEYIFFRNDPIDIKLGGFEFSTIEKSSGVMKGHPAPEFCESRIRRDVSPDLFKAALRNVNYPDSRPFPSYGQPGDIWSAGVLFCELRLHPIPISLRLRKPKHLKFRWLHLYPQPANPNFSATIRFSRRRWDCQWTYRMGYLF